MTEIELPFLVTSKIISRLKKDGEWLKTTVFEDTYYDDEQVSILSTDRWLRRRDGIFQLKVPMHTTANLVTKQYYEIEDDAEIAKRLGLDHTIDLETALKQNGIDPICSFVTRREKWRHGRFIIDLDEATGTSFFYRVGEIEITGDDSMATNEAVEAIHLFAKEHGIPIERVRGKIQECMRIHRPDLFHHLVLLGIF